MTKNLTDAVDEAASVAAAAGMNSGEAVAEAQQLSAAVVESADGAYLAWTAALSLEPSASVFFATAARGRRFRAASTPLLNRLSWTNPGAARQYAQALTEVCQASAHLAPTDTTVAAAASAAAQAQASAVTPSAPSSDPMSEFSARGPEVLDQVLTRLNEQSARVAQLRGPTLDLQGLDPHSGGAFDLTGQRRAPAVTPLAPASPREADDVQPHTPAPRAPGPAPTTAEQPTPDSEPETEPAEPEKSVEELLAELDELVGLESVKKEIHRQAAILRVDALREQAGLKRPTITRHLIFVGNPGTGKTTVARLVAGIYKALGLLSQGQLVEVDRSELVAGYLGQTAIKTAEVATKATGGVLFIDEAYSLNGDQYGEEAINTLVKEMEDNRDDLVVIVAGYPDPMAEFIAQNPGLASRFRTTISFDDYTDAEVEQIFSFMAEAADYDLAEGTTQVFRGQLALQIRDQSFGNGRFARNTLEAAIGRHAWRLRDLDDPTLDDLRTLHPQDLSDETPSAAAEPQVDDASPASTDPVSEAPLESQTTADMAPPSEGLDQ